MADYDAQTSDDRGFVVPELPIATSMLAGELDADTGTLAPLIFNCWYVIALSTNVDRTLGSIKVLGEPLVFFRTEAGKPVVLDDRCAHRRSPLSKGRLHGDTLQCGYHGFTYAASGQCIWAPGLPAKTAREGKLPFGVRSYPCAEQGPWLWVWMGDPDLAGPADIPLPDIEINPAAVVHGYKMNPSNYMMVIENLLDLSHLHFLHGMADLDHVAVVPKEMAAPVNGVAWTKDVEDTEVGGIGLHCGEIPTRRCRFSEDCIQYGPSLTLGIQRREPLPGDPEPVRPRTLHIAHALTPSDHRGTHQFFTSWMSDPFVNDPAEILRVIEDVIFEQDVNVVRDMQAYVEGDVRPGRVEFSMAYDRFGVKMRKILSAMKRRELDASQRPAE